jgi:hypothetical protein
VGYRSEFRQDLFAGQTVIVTAVEVASDAALRTNWRRWAQTSFCSGVVSIGLKSSRVKFAQMAERPSRWLATSAKKGP